MRTSFPGLSLALMLVPGSTFAAEVVAGPVRADVVRVIDGDTLAVTAHIWVGQSLATSVRIRGIDTPELRGGAPGKRRWPPPPAICSPNSPVRSFESPTSRTTSTAVALSPTLHPATVSIWDGR